jgi:hypothetical protein
MTPSSSTKRPSVVDPKSKEHCGMFAAVTLEDNKPPPIALHSGDSHCLWLRTYKYWLCRVYLQIEVKRGVRL